MKSLSAILLSFFLLSFSSAFSVAIVKNDNGTFGSAPIHIGWEESAILKPGGPGKITWLQIYYTGTNSGNDTIYIVGDPAEGALSPTFWVLKYNTRATIVFNYDGKPGWKTIRIYDDVRSDGFDRIIVQHRQYDKGPLWGIDNNGMAFNYSSMYVNPYENNSLGGPGAYSVPGGDFMVRFIFEYDFPAGATSMSAPAPKLLDVTQSAMLLNNAKPIAAGNVAVVDWNGDGCDDINFGSLFYENDRKGSFKNVTDTFKVTANGTSWADYDNDGDMDFYAILIGAYDANTRLMNNKSAIYRNDNGVFVRIDPKVSFKTPYPSPSVDFKLPNPGPQDSVHNPYPTISALWLDYNKDGFPDLFFANNRTGQTINNNYVEHYFPDQLWKNNGDGTFSLVTKDAGIDKGETYSQSGLGGGYYDAYGANAVDYNNDRLTDIFVANYRLVKDNLFKNNGDNTFSEVAALAGVQGEPTDAAGYFGHGMGSDWGDFNNDGFMDLAVGNLGHPDWRGAVSNPSLIYKNLGAPDYKFVETGNQMGLKFFEMNAGVKWMDINMDGFLDIVQAQYSYDLKGAGVDRLSRVYLNQGPAKNFSLKDITWEYGAVIHGAWTPMEIDFDNDGDLDLLMASDRENVKLFRNDIPVDNSWVKFKITGSAADKVSSNAFGTTVKVYAGTDVYTRQIMGSQTAGRWSQAPYTLHFGLGSHKKIDKVEILYPNGENHILNNLDVNQFYNIAYKASPVSIPVSPRLITPANFSTVTGNKILFSWDSIPGITEYELTISNSSGAQVLSQSSVTNRFEVDNNFQQGTTFLWKVKAGNQYSSEWSFFSGENLPSAPVIITPLDSQNIAYSTKFLWKPSVYAMQYGISNTYNIQVSDKDDFSANLIDTLFIKDTVYSLGSKLPSGVQYFWRVRGMNVDKAGQWSNTGKFTIMPAPSKPSLIQPANNSTGVIGKPVFVWSASTFATKYNLQVADNPDFNNLKIDRQGNPDTNYKHIISLPVGYKYYWRAASLNENGESQWSDVWNFTVGTVDIEDDSANPFQLKQNNPNPFSGSTEISFVLNEDSPVELTVMDMAGRELAKIFNGTGLKGENKATWNATGFAPGIYYCRLKSGASQASVKMLLK